jgi:uncharacterized membrane protein YebE (DUF533 family)
MSFIKALATLAAGFAAAKGYDKFRQMGGMAGMEKQLRDSGQPGGIADQMGDMAEKMGLPGGKTAVKDMFAKYGTKAADATGAAEAGLGSLMTSMQGAYASGAERVGEMMGAITGATPASPLVEENAKLMIRAMIQAAKCDGEIDPEERAKIMEHLASASAEEKAFVEEQMNAPLDLAGLAGATGDTMKAQVYSTSLMAMRPDNPAEQAYLKQLGDALGLDLAARNAIHASMGLGPVA